MAEVDDPRASGRVDLGGLWLARPAGLEVRVEADQETGEVVAVTLVLGDGALQVQPFAAPRSEGIWDEVRAEIRAGITRQGGTADEVDGPLGTELRTRVPGPRAADGSPGRAAGPVPRGRRAALVPARRAHRPRGRRSRTPTPTWSRCSATSSWCAAPARWRRATRSRCGCRRLPRARRRRRRAAEDERRRRRDRGRPQPFERGPEITEIR